MAINSQADPYSGMVEQADELFHDLLRHHSY
jgi:hypothetical protein